MKRYFFAVISTIIILIMWSFGLLCYNLGYIFWGYFNGIISGASIYFLALGYFENKKSQEKKNEQED